MLKWGVLASHRRKSRGVAKEDRKTTVLQCYEHGYPQIYYKQLHEISY